ncbi:MAG TPA: phospholipase D family protein [Candidatus Dorea intestinavium]|nr:phospholipase D family protein [Candidatus Dorea intestinavium]
MKVKKVLYVVLIVIAFYLLSVAIPYVKHKEVKASTKENFNPQDCYSDKVGLERVQAILEAKESMEMNLRAINEAKESIQVATYKLMPDQAGKDLMAALMEAADRGVKVEFITNGINEFLDLKNSPYIKAFANYNNVEFYIYNKISVLKPWKIQASLHSKYLVCDDKMYLLGGRNMFNLFMGDYGKHHNKDCELLVYETGDADQTSLAQVRAYHQQLLALSDVVGYHPKKTATKVNQATEELRQRRADLRRKYPKVYQDYDWLAKTVPTNKVTLLNTPIAAKNKRPDLWYYLNELAKQGEEVSIYTPYIIAGKEMYQDLTRLSKEVDQVSIITNAVENGANPFGCSDYLNQRDNILATNVKVHEFSGQDSLHMKAWLIDDSMSVVGSFNMDMRSTYIDTELMLAVDSKDLNQILRADFNKTLQGTRCLEGEHYQYEKNYLNKEMKPIKKVIYAIMRLTSTFTRRFL